MMTSLNAVHDTDLYTHCHSVRESCIPDSTNFTSTVYIRHIQPIHIFIIYYNLQIIINITSKTPIFVQ